MCEHNFEILGKSESCDNEIIISKDGRILTLQGHPELTKHNIYNIDNYTDMDESVSLNLPTVSECFEFRYICHSFMKN